MKTYPLACFSLFLVAVLASPSPAQDKGSDTMHLLQIGGGGRAYTVGECLTAEDMDVEALQYNPAGTAASGSFQVQASYVDWYDTFSYVNTTVSFPVHKNSPRAGNLFFGFKFLSVPEFDWIDINGDVQADKLSQSDLCVTAGYNRALTKTFSAGADLKFVTSRLADAVAFTKLPLLDAGVIWRLGPSAYPARLGFAARNIGIPVSYSGSKAANDLPSELGLGILLPVFRNKTNNSAVNMMGKLTWRFNGVFGADLGTEFVLNGYVTFGGGYRFLADTGKFMIGGSIRIPVAGLESRLNLALLFNSQLNNVFTISLDLIGPSAGKIPVRKGPAERSPHYTESSDFETDNAKDDRQTGNPAPAKTEIAPETAAVVTAANPAAASASNRTASVPARNAPAASTNKQPLPAVVTPTRDLPLLALAALEMKKIPSGQAESVSRTFEYGLQATSRFRIMTSAEIALTPGVESLITGPCSSTECLKTLGLKLNARYVVGGKLEKFGNSFFVDFQFIDVQTGKILLSDTDPSDSEGALRQNINAFLTACGRLVSTP